MRYPLMILLLLTTTWPVVRAQQQPINASARDAFDVLKRALCRSARPTNHKEWAETARQLGLKPMSGDDGMWSLKSTEGETRAQAFFRADETSYFLLFFPNVAEAAPASVLQWLLTQESPELTDGDRLEISLPTSNACGTGSKGEHLLLSMTSGRIIRVSAGIHFKR